MHQILGIREYFDRKSQRVKKADRFFDKNWRVESLSELLLNHENYLELIPEGERYNMFVTFAKCQESKGRVLKEQNIIPFDIDEIDYTYMDKYTEAICRVLQVDYATTGFIATGNGLHVLVETNAPILDTEFFESNRTYYKHLCILIEKEFRRLELPFKEVDSAVFAPAYMTRLPGTENRKKDKATKVVRIIQAILFPIDFDLQERAGMQPLPEGEALTRLQMSNKLKQLPADTKAVLTQCPFMVYASTTGNISERQWYNALNIASHLTNGFSVCHDISKHDPRYNFNETQSKAEQASERSGPMKCSTIEKTYDGCKLCPHRDNKNITSPILLKSVDFVATTESGFRFLTNKGEAGKIDFEGLVKTFFKSNKIVSINRNTFYRHQGKFWESIESDEIALFCKERVKPISRPHEWDEFVRMVRIDTIQDASFFDKSTDGYLNFENGVLKLGAWTLAPHSSHHGFTSVIPFPFIPEAKCPLWDQTLSKVMLSRPHLVDLLKEFFGYCLSNGYQHHKALILTGVGRNGKSTIMETIMFVLGNGNYSSLAWDDVVMPETSYSMRNKLVNFSEEVGKKEFINVSAKMKNLIAGGEFRTRKLYSDSIQVTNRTKFVMACNHLPMTNDTSVGFLERLIIVPFEGYFTVETDANFDPDIKNKLKNEASGILNWMIDGYKKLSTQGSFSKTEETNAMIKEYTFSNNPILGFMEDNLKFEEGLMESSEELYKSFRAYCYEAGVSAIRRTSFLTEFERMAQTRSCGIKKVRARVYRSLNPLSCFQGLCLVSNTNRQASNF